MTYDTREPLQREVEQTVRGPIRGELVVANVEPGAVHQILADVRREQDPPAQVGKIRLSRPVRPGEATPRQQDGAGQEQTDERLEHVEAADRANAGGVELRFPETAPISQHRQENLPGVLVLAGQGIGGAVRLLTGVSGGPSPVVSGVREIDLGQDFDHSSPACLDDSDVVLRVEAAVSEPQHWAALTLRVGRLHECEPLQIALLVSTQSGQRVVLSNDQWAPRAASRTPRRRIG